MMTFLSFVCFSLVPDGPLELPLFQLIPTQRQLVFRGDRLPLQCTASYLDQSVALQWLHDGHVVTTLEDKGIYVEETLLHDCCLLTRYSQSRDEAIFAAQLIPQYWRSWNAQAGTQFHTFLIFLISILLLIIHRKHKGRVILLIDCWALQ